MRPPKFLPTGHGGGAHARPRFHPARSLFGTRRRSQERPSEPPAAGSAPTATRWPAITRPHPWRAASTAPSACPPRRPCSPWRASRRVSPTGTPTRSSGPTARPGSPPGSSQPRSTAWSTPVRWSCCTPPGTGCQSPAYPLAARAGHRRHPHGEHGPGLVPRSGRGGGRGLAAVSLVGSYELLVWLIRTSGAADREPPAEHLCTGAACRAARRPVPASAVDGERPAGSERGPSARRGGPRVRPPGSRRSPPAGSVTMRRLRPARAMTRRWPRTGSACRPATRCRETPARPDVRTHLPPLGPEPESPMPGKHCRSRTRPGTPVTA